MILNIVYFYCYCTVLYCIVLCTDKLCTTYLIMYDNCFWVVLVLWYILQCYYVEVFLLCIFQRKISPCMAINVSVQSNGGLLPDIILLTKYYDHRGTHLNAMK